MKKFTLFLVVLLILTFIPTSALAQEYSATVDFTDGKETRTVVFNNRDEKLGLQGFKEITGGLSPRYFIGWVRVSDPQHPDDIYNPDQPIYTGNEKISDIFPTGNSEAVTFRILRIDYSKFDESKNKYEINKGMGGNETLPNANIHSLERDSQGRISKINVLYDEKFGDYPLFIKTNFTLDRYTSLFTYQNINNILDIKEESFKLNPGINIPNTFADFNLLVDERINIQDNLNMILKSYIYEPYNAIGDTGRLNEGNDPIRMSYKLVNEIINSPNPNTNIQFNKSEYVDIDASYGNQLVYKPVETPTNHLVIRAGVKNIKKPGNTPMEATVSQIYEDSELYFEEPRNLVISNALAKNISEGKEQPIKISGFMQVFYQINLHGVDVLIPDGTDDESIFKLRSQDLVINFVKKDGPTPLPEENLNQIIFDYGYKAPVEEKKEIHKPYIKGYHDGSIQPEGFITRGETAAIFARLMGMTDENNYISNYSDVKITDWYGSYIGYLEDKNIINGYPDGSFKPQEKITRAEYAAIAAAFTDKIGNSNFPDIENNWAKAYISKVSEEGWIKGYPDGTYKPDQHITRAEAVKITNSIFKRYADVKFINENLTLLIKFNDLNNDHWAFYELMESSQGHEFIRIENNREEWKKVF